MIKKITSDQIIIFKDKIHIHMKDNKYIINVKSYNVINLNNAINLHIKVEENKETSLIVKLLNDSDSIVNLSFNKSIKLFDNIDNIYIQYFTIYKKNNFFDFSFKLLKN